MVNVNIPNNVQKENNRFMGWSKIPNGSIDTEFNHDITYVNQEFIQRHFHSTNSITLYAVYTSATWMVTYVGANTNGKTISNLPEPSVGRYNVDTGKYEITISDTIPTCDGYTFNNWTAKVGGETFTFEPGKTYSFSEKPSDMDVYSQWTKVVNNKIKIRYYKDNTLNDYKEIEYEKGNIQLAGEMLFTRGENEGIDSWVNKDNGDTYEPGSIHTINQDLELYATWKSLEYDSDY